MIVGDVHLSHSKPFYRSPESDWYAAQDYYLGCLREVCEMYECPLIVCGDLFDRWSVVPELITFAIKALPKSVWSIPGQHDLPNHDWNQVHRSAYGVLMESDRIADISGNTRIGFRGTSIKVSGYEWGNRVRPMEYDPEDGDINIAICHQYIHNGGKTRHAEASTEDTVDFQRRNTKGFDAVFFGDNHVPFESGRHFNCGSLMTRHASDRHYEHGFFVIHSDKLQSVQRVIIPEDHIECVDVDDVMDLVETGSNMGLDIAQVGAALSALWSDGLDFVSAVRSFCRDNEVADDVAKRVMEAIDRARPRT